MNDLWNYGRRYTKQFLRLLKALARLMRRVHRYWAVRLPTPVLSESRDSISTLGGPEAWIFFAMPLWLDLAADYA